MVSGTLYCHRDSFRAHRVLVAAKYGEANVKLVSNLPAEEFAKKFHFETPIAFEDGDFTLVTAASIASYVGGKTVVGATDKVKAEIHCWCAFADCDYLPAVLGVVLPQLSVAAYNKQQVESVKAELFHHLGLLNEYLLCRTYLVGESVTLADITLACNLLLAYQHVLDASLRKQFQNVTRWFETIVHQPNFAAVVGEVKLCEKPAEHDAKKYKEFAGSSGAHHHAAGGGDPAGKKDKKPKQQEAAAPKAEKPKASQGAEEDDDMDETEKALAREEPKQDPFQQFPKGSFVMDEWKKMYSNNDTRSVALPWFWQHFDSQNYSVWYCEYKYPQELTQAFMSCNLIAGMFQRLDKMHKNAFGSMILFGQNNDSQIAGVWLWRGPELAFTLSSDWQTDYESYTWKKLDVNDAATKTLIENYFAWEGDWNGKPVNQGKIFK